MLCRGLVSRCSQRHGAAFTRAAGRGRPSIVIIISDDQGYRTSLQPASSAEMSAPMDAWREGILRKATCRNVCSRHRPG
jgi:hypothetical protein